MSSNAMIHAERPIRELMTPAPHAVDIDEPVADVRHRMQVLGVHHLPVLDDGRVVAMVSDRELLSIGQLGSPNASLLTVGDVANEGCLVVGPEMPLLAVVQAMADQRTDSCAVVEHGRLAGILTAHDVMQLFASVLFGTATRQHGFRPSDVRERISAEHAVLREQYAVVEELAQRVLSGEEQAQGPLRERCRELYHTLLRHIQLEDTLLAPALCETDAFGPQRAQEMLAGHERQRRDLFEALIAVESSSEYELAESVGSLIAELRADMAHEERALLDPDLLKDDPIEVDSMSG